MRLDGPVKDLTEAQKRQADIAGVPADRPGLGSEYPKMIYKPGENPRHMHLNEPLRIGNGSHDPRFDRLAPGAECQTAFVDSPEDEVEALADGWFLSPDPDQQARDTAKRAAETAKDDEIAVLKAALAARDAQPEKRGPGRPPNAA